MNRVFGMRINEIYATESNAAASWYLSSLVARTPIEQTEAFSRSSWQGPSSISSRIRVDWMHGREVSLLLVLIVVRFRFSVIKSPILGCVPSEPGVFSQNSFAAAADDDDEDARKNKRSEK